MKGNHDYSYEKDPPSGCVCIEDKIVELGGIRILGLGGSYRYHPKKPNMYTEKEMQRRIWRLWFQLFKHKGFDVLVTHAPAYGLGDLEDLPHRGFMCFVKLIHKYKPRYHLHGHVHKNYAMKIPTVTNYGETTIVNAFDSYVLEL